MSILVDGAARVLIQGITGRQASWSAKDMLDYGTNVVAGVVPGRGGTDRAGVPIFDYVDDAVAATGANTVLTYVPAHNAAEAVVESLDAGVPLVIYPGDLLPVHDALRLRRHALGLGALLVGPNTPGVITPGTAKVGFMPSSCYESGSLGVISKSGSLSYELCARLTEAGVGQSTVVGVGGDPVKGLSMGEAAALFHADPATQALLVLGEIGGGEEYDIARYALQPGAKPVVAFLVGKTAPPGRKLGHAGALIGSEREGYFAKVTELRASGVAVADSLAQAVELSKERCG